MSVLRSGGVWRPRLLFVSAVLLAPVSAAAQASGPYKLIITWYQAGVVVIDYPTAARCEQARRAVEAEVQRRARQNLAAMPEGSRILGAPAHGAFCIPG